MQRYQNYNSVKVKLRKLKPSERAIRSWKTDLKKPQKSWLQHKRSSKLMIKQQRELLRLCKRKWHSELIRWASYYEFCTLEMKKNLGWVSSCSCLWDCCWGSIHIASHLLFSPQLCSHKPVLDMTCPKLLLIYKVVNYNLYFTTLMMTEKKYTVDLRRRGNGD